MTDSNTSHEVPLSAPPEQRIDTELQKTVLVNEDQNPHPSAAENSPVPQSRTDRSSTTAPTSITHSLASGQGTAIDAPETEVGGPQPQEPMKKPVVLRSWLFEILALLIGVLSFAGIITILGVYNGQPQLELARDVNINTIIAILSTTLRATMAFIATEVIGQSKWEWLESPRPLRHVERLDNAGRGALGSMKFLFFVSKPSFAVIGALLVIASYVLDPFSQQLAKTYPCNIPSDEQASIYVARRVSQYFISERPLIWLAAMTGLNGLNLNYGTSEASKSQLFRCPSGNCTFTSNSGITHTSAGICSTCTDVTSDLMEIDLGNQSTTYRFPQQPNLNLTWPLAEPYSPYFLARSSLSNADPFWGDSLSTTSILTFSAGACESNSKESRIYNKRRCHKMTYDTEFGQWTKDMDVGIVAVNCTLWPCLRRYSGEVSLGTLKETPVSQELMDWSFMNETLDGSPYQVWFTKFEPCEYNGRWYDSSNITEAPTDSNWIFWRDGQNKTHQAPKQCVIALSGEVSFAITEYQHRVMQGNGDHISMNPTTVSWLPTLARGGNATLESISTSFDGMASGFTDFMRGSWEEMQNERFDVAGVASKSAVCIRADWPWLVYPGVLLSSTTILLVAAYISSLREGGKRPVWKSTILPFLFYNLKMDRDQDQDQADESGMDVPLLQLKELETLADKTVARFSADAAAPGFIVENGGTSSGASAGQQVGLLQRLFKPRAD